MFSGYLLKRNANPHTPTMQRVYCCLWGTLLMDFDSDTDADSHSNVRGTVEIIGTAKWDGLAGSTTYQNGFLVVTHTGSIYYLSASCEREMDEWMQQLRYGLECNFANPEVVRFKPSKALYDFPSRMQAPQKCAKSGTVFGSSVPVYCSSCGRGFTAEHVTDSYPLLQLSCEMAERVCVDCKYAQTFLLWLKEMNYVTVADLHERTPEVLIGVQRYKASFKFRRQCSQALEHAARLFDLEEISLDEFEELRRIDHDFRTAAASEEKEKLRMALIALGNDVQTIISLLSNPTATYSARSMGSDTLRNSTTLYLEVIIRLIEIGDREPDLLDFFWPQLLQIHLLLSKTRSQASMLKVNLLHCAFLAVAKKIPFFATKLAWCLIGSISDFTDRKISDNQYAACMCLLLELEILTSGSALCLSKHFPVSPLPGASNPSVAAAGGTIVKKRPSASGPHLSPFPTAAISSSDLGPMQHRVMSNILTPSASQQQEIVFELHVMFRARAAQFQSYREKRFEHLVREIDDKNRGWDGTVLAPNDDNDNSGIIGHNDFPPPTILDLMLHLGCMDYSKLTFPMPMTGGGILSGHIFAKVAVGMYDNTGRNPSTPPPIDVTHSKPAAAAVSNNGQASANSTSSAYDYDYIAEWVNHRSDDIGLQLDFIDTVTEIVDQLRNVDRPIRTDVFRTEMAQLERSLASRGDWFGYEPCGAATEPRYKIVHFVLSDCRVFRTKARAPSLVACIVRRDDTDLEWSMPTSGDRRSSEIMRNRSVSNPENGGNDTSMERSSLGGAGVFHRKEEQIVAAELEAAEGMIVQLAHSDAVSKTIMRVRASSVDATAGKGPTSSPFASSPPPIIEVPSPSESSAKTDSPIAFDGTSRRGSRLSSHSKAHNMSLVHQSRSIEKELNSSFGSKANGVEHEEVGSVDATPSFGHTEGQVADPVASVAVIAAVVGHPPIDSEGGSAHGAKHKRHFSLDKETVRKSFIEKENNKQHPSLSPESAAKAKAAAMEEERLHAEVTKKVVASARALLTAGKISNKEFETLINCDTRYQDEATRTELELASLRLEECFGEPWEEHKERLLSEYVLKHPSLSNSHQSDDLLSTKQWPELDLRWFIVKSNDDLRQEVCCLQLIELCQEIFADVTSHGSTSKCDLWLKTYRIASTNSTTGVVQVIPDTMSLDALKKTEGFVSLSRHFERVYGTSPERLHKAKQDFVASLAAYSVVCYIFQIKDRHNGNILMDRDGHIIHIDFGFLLGIAPGGSFSIESAPFKLTEEMVDTFGGLDSPYFSEFLRAFTSGFLALRANSETIVSTLSLMSTQSTFPCFAGKDTNVIIDKLRGRFRTDLSVKDTVQHCLDLIIESYSHYGTKQYDNFQWLTNGIVQ